MANVHGRSLCPRIEHSVATPNSYSVTPLSLSFSRSLAASLVPRPSSRVLCALRLPTEAVIAYVVGPWFTLETFSSFFFSFLFFFKRPMLKRRKWRENGCLLRIKGILCYIQRIAYVGMRNKRFTLDIYARGEFYWPGDKVSWIEQGFTLNIMDRIVASSRWNIFRVMFCK